MPFKKSLIIPLACLMALILQAQASVAAELPPGNYAGSVTIKNIPACMSSSTNIDVMAQDNFTMDASLKITPKGALFLIGPQQGNTAAADYFDTTQGSLQLSGFGLKNDNPKSLYRFNFALKAKSGPNPTDPIAYEATGQWEIADGCPRSYSAILSLTRVAQVNADSNCTEIHVVYPTTPPNMLQMDDQKTGFNPTMPGATDISGRNGGVLPVLSYFPQQCILAPGGSLKFRIVSMSHSVPRNSQIGHPFFPDPYGSILPTIAIDPNTGEAIAKEAGSTSEIEVKRSDIPAPGTVQVRVSRTACTSVSLEVMPRELIAHIPSGVTFPHAQDSVLWIGYAHTRESYLPLGCDEPQQHFASEETELATVNDEGLVKAQGPGIATITVTAGNLPVAASKVTIFDAPCTSMELHVFPQDLYPGQTSQISYDFLPSHCYVPGSGFMLKSPLKIETADTEIATVDLTSLKVAAGRKAGEDKLTAGIGLAWGNLSATTILRVKTRPKCQSIHMAYDPKYVVVSKKSSAPSVAVGPADCGSPEQGDKQFALHNSYASFGATIDSRSGVVTAGSQTGEIRVDVKSGDLSDYTEIDIYAQCGPLLIAKSLNDAIRLKSEEIDALTHAAQPTQAGIQAAENELKVAQAKLQKAEVELKAAMADKKYAYALDRYQQAVNTARSQMFTAEANLTNLRDQVSGQGLVRLKADLVNLQQKRDAAVAKSKTDPACK